MQKLLTHHPISATAQRDRLRALLPEDLALVEAVQSLGYKGAAAQRGEQLGRVKIAAERARERLRMMA